MFIDLEHHTVFALHRQVPRLDLQTFVLYTVAMNKKPRKKLSIDQRAAQFAPFAALTGLGDMYKEEMRLTVPRPATDDDLAYELNAKLSEIMYARNGKCLVHVSFFVEDRLKAGGHMIDMEGFTKEIDLRGRLLIMEDGSRIPLDDICGLELC